MTGIAATSVTEHKGSAVPKGPFAPLAYPIGEIVDLTDLDLFLDGQPNAEFARLRREAPVYWNPEKEPYEPGFWAITRYHDIVHVSKNPQIFSSGKAGILITLGDPSTMDLQTVRALLGGMIAMDAPQHLAYRRIVTPGFAPKALAALESQIRARVNELIDAIAERGACDMVTTLSEQLPIWTLARIMGAPDADLPRIIDWTNRLTGTNDPDFNADPSETFGVYMDLLSYGREMMEHRRKHPTEDITSLVANAKLDGADGLQPWALDGFFLLMVIAGNETTRNTISGGMEAFGKHPDQWAKLRSDPSLLPNAVEEMLRYVSPVVYMRRTALKDTRIRDQEIREGDKVVMWYGAANRDEEVFADGERFDITRPNAREHLAFGIGPHFCLGARLGQMQIQIMYEELLRRLPDIHPSGPARRMRTNFINGIKSLPVEFTPEKR